MFSEDKGCNYTCMVPRFLQDIYKISDAINLLYFYNIGVTYQIGSRKIYFNGGVEKL